MNIREFIEYGKHIEPYLPNSTLDTISRDLGINVEDVLKLNANENLFLEKSVMRDILIETASEIDPRLYPQGEEGKLKQLIAEQNHVKPKQVVVSAGGDQVIEFLFSLLKLGDSVIAVTPTFSMYSRTALQRGLWYREASLESGFSLNVDKTLKTAKESSILVLCNPNNPTGNQFPRDYVLRLVKGFSGLVLVDEAYQEYSRYSLVDETAKYENLVVLRTFSKAYGLAGLRLGFYVTNEDLASTLRERYTMPYPVPNIVLKTGYKILEKQDLIRETLEKTKIERAWLLEELDKIEGVQAFRSETNFVLFNTDKAYNEVYMALLTKGVLVRKIGRVPGYTNCLRVTVAPRSMLKRFLTTLKEATK
ncbi:MAG: histidinol-phosphate transaminase [Candidatus Thorarchaeota archaeon]